MCRNVGVLRVVKSVLGVVKSVILRYGRSGLGLNGFKRGSIVATWLRDCFFFVPCFLLLGYRG